MEQMEFVLLFRWFVGLWRRQAGLGRFHLLEEPQLEGDVAARFLATLLARPRVKQLLS